MIPTATTVGTYLRDLPPDRRVAMARVCSMIRRSARGVRESMRYGLAFYELDGPLFALESGKRHMSLFVAEPDVMVKHKDALPGVNPGRSMVRFSDLNRLPLDVVEKIVRDSVSARRVRVTEGRLMTQADLLRLWAIKEEAVQIPVVVAKVASLKSASVPAKAESDKPVAASAAQTAAASAKTGGSVKGAKKTVAEPTNASKAVKAVKGVKPAKAVKVAKVAKVAKTAKVAKAPSKTAKTKTNKAT